MDIKDRAAVITGAASGIGQCLALKLAEEHASGVAVVDIDEKVTGFCDSANSGFGRNVMIPFQGDVTKADFRERVFTEMEEQFGQVSICVPAAAITRDRLSVKLVESNGSSSIDLYDEREFYRVLDIDLVAPIYWALRTVGSVAKNRARSAAARWNPEEGVQGSIVLIGSVSSAGNRGQISYATAKAGLEGAQATLSIEAIFYGVRCSIIHPGFTDTPMVRALGDDLIQNKILPNTQLKRLIRPDEIAEAICFMLTNSSVTGALWADAGWHPPD